LGQFIFTTLGIWQTSRKDVSIVLTSSRANTLFNLKKTRALLALGVLSGITFSQGTAKAGEQAEKLQLKSSANLAPLHTSRKGTTRTATPQARSVLVNLELFRGVSVNADPPARATVQNRQQREVAKREKESPMIQAVHGGLQLGLNENLSLVYSPGRLSRQAFDSGNQGLYLLSGLGGQANWYVGVESSSYPTSPDSRRASNSAQFGVILSLD